ncbi:MAG: helix-turn-helix domain-containing protein [Bacteroidales bacterium]|nr:helix-turn-helix domain-containing protein [Bacteroidales bacterium]
MKDRIRLFLESENKSSSQFAAEIGVQASGVSHVLSGRNKPSLDFIIKMLDRYENLNNEWLLFGRGEMYKSMEEPRIVEGSLSFNDIDKEPAPGNIPDSEESAENPPERDFASSKDTENSQTGDYEARSEKIIIFYSDGTFREYNPR